MNNINAGMIVVLSSMIAAVSQIMLKKAADKAHESKLAEYFNLNVIGSYLLLLFTTFLNMWAMIYLPYKLVPIIGASAYIFVVILSRKILNEKIGKKKIVGMILIILGIVIFNITV